MHVLSLNNLPVTQRSTDLLSTMCSAKHLITENSPLHPTEVMGGLDKSLDEEINTAQ